MTLLMEKVVIAYQDVGNSNYATAIVGTVSGTSISFGSAAVFNSTKSLHQSATYDSSNQKVVIIAYRDDGNNQYGTAIVGTVSGTSISFGSPVTVFNSATIYYASATYDSTNNKVVIAYSLIMEILIMEQQLQELYLELVLVLDLKLYLKLLLPITSHRYMILLMIK